MHIRVVLDEVLEVVVCHVQRPPRQRGEGPLGPLHVLPAGRLAQLGDRSRLSTAQKIVDDKGTDPNDRMRALNVCAQLGDDSRREAARKVGHDEDLFLASRMAGSGSLAWYLPGGYFGSASLTNGRPSRSHRLRPPFMIRHFAWP